MPRYARNDRLGYSGADIQISKRVGGPIGRRAGAYRSKRLKGLGEFKRPKSLTPVRWPEDRVTFRGVVRETWGGCDTSGPSSSGRSCRPSAPAMDPALVEPPAFLAAEPERVSEHVHALRAGARGGLRDRRRHVQARRAQDPGDRHRRARGRRRAARPKRSRPRLRRRSCSGCSTRARSRWSRGSTTSGPLGPRPARVRRTRSDGSDPVDRRRDARKRPRAAVSRRVQERVVLIR